LGTGTRATLRVLANAVFGLFTMMVTKPLVLWVVAQPGLVGSNNVPAIDATDVNSTAFMMGSLLFFGLLLRDIARGIGREG